LFILDKGEAGLAPTGSVAGLENDRWVLKGALALDLPTGCDL
jgi:hypothetical protein